MTDHTERNWRPSATMDNLKLRANALNAIRSFFAARAVLEVNTPVLSHATVTDVNIESFKLDSTNHPTLYLHTSPEFPMKRLLASGSGDIFQICPVFRDGEYGSRHNPEFTMLEWYRIDFDHHQLIQEVDLLIRCVLGDHLQDSLTISYADTFTNAAGIDPHAANSAEILAVLEKNNIAAPRAANRDQLLDLLAATVVVSSFNPAQPTFVHDYPATQAALARIRPGNPPVAERFELFLGGMELANGFHELADPAEQAQRFDRDLAHRRAQGQHVPLPDYALLAALEHGLPDCAGVALGLDRLLMIAAQSDDIGGMISFEFSRA